MEMLQQFKEFVSRQKLFGPDEKVLLAVSGGLDSSVMAELFHRAGYKCGIAHCNFQLRADESDADELFVKDMSARLQLPFFATRFSTSEYAEQNRLSIQVAARELRYEWFEKLRTEKGYSYVATAHHRQDVTETILLNLAKGTGLAGMHGIREKRGSIVRPMLFTTREEIADFAALNSVQYRTDSSNSELKYERNRIRKLVLPVLRDINPSLDHTFYENAERFKGYEKIIATLIGPIREKLFQFQQDFISISIPLLQELQPTEIYLFELLRPYNFPNALIPEIIQSFSAPSGRQFFSPTHRLVKDRETLQLAPLQTSFEEFEILPEHIEKGEIKKFSRVISFRKMGAAGIELDQPADTACLDLEKLEFPLKIRSWKTGDYFYPLGIQGKKKLSDYFTDKKLSLIEKERCWILESGGKIAWVAGHRMDGRFMIEPDSREVLSIRITEV